MPHRPIVLAKSETWPQDKGVAAVCLESVEMTATDGTPILRDLSLEVDAGELMVLVGKSGSGKTSIIRAIAGLEAISAGSIWFDGVDVQSRPISERDVGMVFQKTGALYPNFTARRNVSFGLRIRKTSEPTIRDRVAAEARALGITAIMERWPRELSAGHQQLVQIARAMVKVPDVLLLDEPMAYVDAPTRARLRRDLRELQQGYGLTTILATNDADEAMAMADRIAAIDHGAVVQVGTPEQLYARPVDVNVATFTGRISLLGAEVLTETEGYWLNGEGFRLRGWSDQLKAWVGKAVVIGVRPDAVRFLPRSDLRVVIDSHSYGSGTPAAVAKLGGSHLTLPSTDQPVGSEVPIAIDKFLVFSPDGDLIVASG